MTLIVETGSGLENAESYLSVADCDIYHEAMNNSSWTGSTSNKEAALRKATQYLDSTYEWIGSIYSLEQALSWPRTNVYDAQGRDLANSVPVKLKNACAELALAALSADLVVITDNSNFVKREKVEGLEIEYVSGAPIDRQYRLVDKLLMDLFTSKTNGSTAKLLRV